MGRGLGCLLPEDGGCLHLCDQVLECGRQDPTGGDDQHG